MWADILSPSKMEKYLQCPSQYWHIVEAGTSARPSFNWRVGSCFHEAIEVYVKSKLSMSFAESMDWAIKNINAYPPEVWKEALEIGEKWLSYDPLPPMRQVIALEETFGPTGSTLMGKSVNAEIDFDSGLRIRGIIDIVWMEGSTIVVGDYKTARAHLSVDQLATKVQAMAYALALHKYTNGSKKIRVEFYMIRYPENGPVKWAPKEDEFKSIENYLSSLQWSIKNDSSHETTPSVDCRYCSFNYTCDQYAKWMSASPTSPLVWDAMPLNDILTEYDEWNERYLSAKRVNEDLRDLALHVLQREHIDRVDLENGACFKIHRRTIKKYDEEAQLIANRYKGTKIPPEVAIELAQRQHNTYGNPYLQRIGRRKKNG